MEQHNMEKRITATFAYTHSCELWIDGVQHFDCIETQFVHDGDDDADFDGPWEKEHFDAMLAYLESKGVTHVCDSEILYDHEDECAPYAVWREAARKDLGI